MRIWSRVHRVPTTFISLAATAGLVAVAGDVPVPVPGLSRADASTVPLALIAPLAASAALVRGAYAGPADLEGVAVRPVHAYRACLVAVACAAWLLAVAAVGEAVPHGAAAARNLVGFTGLASVAALWRLDLASAVPAAYLIVAMLLGTGTGSSWDWPVAVTAGPATWVIPVAALALGLTAPRGLPAFRSPPEAGPGIPGPARR